MVQVAAREDQWWETRVPCRYVIRVDSTAAQTSPFAGAVAHPCSLACRYRMVPFMDRWIRDNPPFRLDQGAHETD
jgi:hypothetical protein